jgi:nicotinamide riboside kinase
MKIRRVCLFGGPNAGKTGLSHKLVGELIARSKSVEHIYEVVKPKAYQKRLPTGFKQLKIFSKQLDIEETFLAHGVDIVVTDSPIIMNAAYSKKYGFKGWEEIVSLAKKFEEEYPALNVYLPRKYKYNPKGRFQSEEEAKEIDLMVKNIMIDHLPPDSLRFETHEFETLLNCIEEECCA